MCRSRPRFPSPARPADHGYGEHEQSTQRKGLQVAPAGGLPGVPAQQVLQARHGVQVRAPACQRGGPERTSHCLLRQHQGTHLISLSLYHIELIY